MAKSVNPGFKVGKQALVVLFRENPQLGCYVSISTAEVERLTSGSAIIKGWDMRDVSYKFSDFSQRGEKKEGYGTVEHRMYPAEIALEILREGEQTNTFLGYRCNAHIPSFIQRMEESL